MAIKVFVGKKAVELELKPTQTVLEARKEVARFLKKSVHRIELRSVEVDEKTKKPVARYEKDEATLASLGADKGAGVLVKDLGPQMSYRGVFYAEYAGPIAIIAAFALARPLLFGESVSPLRFWEALTAEGASAPEGSASWTRFVQALGVALWLAHFAKRELETAFVHKFSRPTMPLFNLFKNSTYYWGFAAGVGYFLVHPQFTAPGKTQVALAATGWALSQLVNFAVHFQLSRMRKGDGDKARTAPGGPLFSLVSCPNYTAEVSGWIFWSLLTQIGVAYGFTLAGLIQMAEWSLAKHRGYGKADPEYRKLGRKAIIPFVL